MTKPFIYLVSSQFAREFASRGGFFCAETGPEYEEALDALKDGNPIVVVDTCFHSRVGREAINRFSELGTIIPITLPIGGASLESFGQILSQPPRWGSPFSSTMMRPRVETPGMPKDVVLAVGRTYKLNNGRIVNLEGSREVKDLAKIYVSSAGEPFSDRGVSLIHAGEWIIEEVIDYASLREVIMVTLGEFFGPESDAFVATKLIIERSPGDPKIIKGLYEIAEKFKELAQDIH